MVTGSFFDMVENIVNVVLNMYFNYVTDPDLKEDLKQEGFLKAYEMLKTGNYNPQRDLRTYIYTGVRNSMTNFLYHHKKESNLDIDDFYSLEDKSEVCSYNIDLNLLHRVCLKYINYGDYTNTVLKYFSEIGLYNGEVPESTIKEIPFVKNAIIGELIWRILGT